MKLRKRRVAVNVELRKESHKFDGYLKYEVTIKNENGDLEKVPAYGKDLQDALSRVVHDSKVEKIDKVLISKVSNTGWAIAWFLGFVVIVLSIYSTIEHKYTGFWIIGGLASYAIATLSINNWFTLRNRAK